jgi:hypothetical protein
MNVTLRPRSRPVYSLLTLCAFSLPLHWVGSTGAAHAQTPTAKSPPNGIAIPQADREELTKAAASLAADIRKADSPKLSPALRALLPDLEIFPKAVSWAVELDEFYDVKQVAAARDLLKEGRSRLDAFQRGESPWTSATGLVVRGFRSAIDQSVQPYAMVIPGTPIAPPRRLDIWLHGRNDKLTELAFLAEHMKKAGEFTPANAMVLHPYGRFCNAFKFAGETDVLEALAHATEQYGADPLHTAVRGFSMGGAGCWHLAGHMTSRWAVAAPGAGFVETAEYAKVFAPEKPVPPWWEQVLWRLYDVPGYVRNFANRPVVVYSGEEDAQKRAADQMVAAAAAAGITMPHLIGPGVGHKYHPETKLEVAKLVDVAANQGAPRNPKRVHLTTFTLRYNQMDWVRIDSLKKHWEESSVDALIEGGAIKITTKAVTGLTLSPDEAKPGTTLRINIDGQSLKATAKQEGISLTLQDGEWTSAPAKTSLCKQHALQGPVDDAFMAPFVFVKPTGTPKFPKADAWARTEMERAIKQWKIVFRGEIQVVEDTAVTPALMASHNLILWGDPGSNRLISEILPSLPMRWTEKELVLGTGTYPSTEHAPVLIYPNPKAPAHYIVLNSSFTFRQGSDTTNALQTPKLPDWAVVDLRIPPGILAPGLIRDAGFFNESWK